MHFYPHSPAPIASAKALAGVAVAELREAVVVGVRLREAVPKRSFLTPRVRLCYYKIKNILAQAILRYVHFR